MTHRGTPCVLIATGASGGHVYPALSVVEKLKAHNVKLHVALGGHKFAELIQQAELPYTHLPAKAFNVRSILRKLQALIILTYGVFVAFKLIHKLHPNVILSTGGYASVPTVVAGWIAGVPIVLHEQNVEPGRANRFLARFADTIAITFEQTRKSFQNLLKSNSVQIHTTGNPTRDEITRVAGSPLPPQPPFTILVSGGSQGARILTDVIPATLSRLPKAKQRDIKIIHQARPEDTDRAKLSYAETEVNATVTSYIKDMPIALQNCHLVIGRAGTGTVMETALVGRPAIYVPLLLAEGHQLSNAMVAEQAGAAVILAQDIFSAETLLPHLQNLMDDPEKLTAMSQAAKTIFNINAAETVAKLVLSHAQSDIMHQAEHHDIK